MEQIPISPTDFGTNSFAENPEPRVPCVLVLDVSGSMTGQSIDELNDGIRAFKDALNEDKLASKRVEPAIVTFGNSVQTLVDFGTAESFYPPILEADGLTPMGEAVNRALDILEQRKSEYKKNGIAYYRPWVFLISDGTPTDSWQAAAARAKEGDTARSFAFFSVGVGGADLGILGEFTNRKPLMLKGLMFRELFVWLSSSLRSVSRSNPGDDVPLSNPATPDGWAAV